MTGSGSLNRLVETARDHVRGALSENTLAAYARDWGSFARWCRRRGAGPLPPSRSWLRLYLADLAAPGGKLWP